MNVCLLLPRPLQLRRVEAIWLTIAAFGSGLLGTTISCVANDSLAVVDEGGRVTDVDNLTFAHASLFRAGSSVDPQGTVNALPSPSFNGRGAEERDRLLPSRKARHWKHCSPSVEDVEHLRWLCFTDCQGGKGDIHP
jgi:hypothetical protein